MRRRRIAASAGCLVLLLAFAASGCGRGDPGVVFAGTTKIELNKDLEKGDARRTVVVTDPAEIARLVAAIRLQKKKPCPCGHTESAVFTTPKGVIDVSLCDHCFDFGGKTYDMPAEFYRLFQWYFK
jgi:hypothetical protein